MRGKLNNVLSLIIKINYMEFNFNLDLYFQYLLERLIEVNTDQPGLG